LRLPKDVGDREGLAEGTIVSLTIKNGELRSVFLRPDERISQTIYQ
jgi:hypothetical protein